MFFRNISQHVTSLVPVLTSDYHYSLNSYHTPVKHCNMTVRDEFSEIKDWHV